MPKYITHVQQKITSNCSKHKTVLSIYFAACLVCCHKNAYIVPMLTAQIYVFKHSD